MTVVAMAEQWRGQIPGTVPGRSAQDLHTRRTQGRGEQRKPIMLSLPPPRVYIYFAGYSCLLQFNIEVSSEEHEISMCVQDLCSCGGSRCRDEGNGGVWDAVRSRRVKVRKEVCKRGKQCYK